MLAATETELFRTQRKGKEVSICLGCDDAWDRYEKLGIEKRQKMSMSFCLGLNSKIEICRFAWAVTTPGTDLRS